jgi:hypothetical protein
VAWCGVAWGPPDPAPTDWRSDRRGRRGDTLRPVRSVGASVPAELTEKTDRYERMLVEALAAAEVAVPPGTPLGTAAADCEEMARAYLADGRHFRTVDDPVNALAAFSYGYGWLDCGVRLGLFDVPSDSDLFTMDHGFDPKPDSRGGPHQSEPGNWEDDGGRGPGQAEE